MKHKIKIYIAGLISLAMILFLSSRVIALPLKSGPKIRVAVAQFGTTDRFASVYGGWNIGGGLAAELVTSLIESGRVVVVERAVLSKVLIEQEMGQSNLSSQLTQTPSGQLLGVDYLIVGEVTEFDERQMGAGGQGAIMKGIGPKISGDVEAAHVAVDLRIVDTRTGEIVESHRAEGKVWEKSVGGKINYGVIDFGGDMFHKTPLGKATRQVIGDALDFVLNAIEKRTKDFTWLARVIEVDGANVYFDAGARIKIAPHDKFTITSVEKVLTDPETNEILGLVEHPVGVAEAVAVENKYTKAVMINGGARPQIGDLVRFASPSLQKDITLLPSEAGYHIME